MAYSLFLDGVLFPITPSKLNMKIDNKNKTISLINLGEVNLLRSAGLTDIDFELLLPQVKYPFATYVNGFQTAEYFLKVLEDLKLNKKSFRFIFVREMPNGSKLFDTNLEVSLEDYSIKENAKDGFDVVVNINLKQYKHFSTKTLKITNTTNLTSKAKVVSTRPTSVVTKKSYTVVKGDTLWAISKKYLGTGTRYPELAKLNNISNPNRIYPGQVVKLP